MGAVFPGEPLKFLKWNCFLGGWGWGWEWISRNFDVFFIFFSCWFRDFQVYFQHFLGGWPAFGTLGVLRKCLIPASRPWKNPKDLSIFVREYVSRRNRTKRLLLFFFLKMVAPTRMHKHRNATTHVCFEFIHTEVVGCIFEYFCCGWLGVSWKKLFKPVQMENIGMFANLRYTLGSMALGIFIPRFAIKINPTCRYIYLAGTYGSWSYEIRWDIIYIYPEPKWPLFWLKRALFWRVDLQE